MPSIFSIIKTLFSDSATAKGTRGEWKSGFFLSTFPSAHYETFHDITLHTDDNSTTQIDHVVISKFGVFIIEVKNYSGSIYGSEKDYQWIQAFNENSKYQFLNPLIQNNKHLKTVQKIFQVADKDIHSMVVFMEKVTFKTDMPANVMTLRAMKSYIKQFNQPVFTEHQCKKFATQIETRRLTTGKIANTVHMANIKKKQKAKQEKEALLSKQLEPPQEVTKPKEEQLLEKSCPKCQSVLVKRVAKTGKNVGNAFYGCKNFPTCRHVENI